MRQITNKVQNIKMHHILRLILTYFNGFVTVEDKAAAVKPKDVFLQSFETLTLIRKINKSTIHEATKCSEKVISTLAPTQV